MSSWRAATAAGLLCWAWTSLAYQNFSRNDLLQSTFSLEHDRDPSCPPCFNCVLPTFKCAQFGSCNAYNGKCSCPAGFGGDDCSKPLCGSLAMGKDRAPRIEEDCECVDGWEGINCNVCKTNEACDAMMPDNEGGVCYNEGVVVHENHQMCDVTNRKIIDQLKDKAPQITFSCDKDDATCNFQFWIGKMESFYCALDTCSFDYKVDYDKNTTVYQCDHIKCACVPGRMLCGEEGSIDIGDFLDQSIAGPASLTRVETETKDSTKFEEPAMNDLIKSVFGDEFITLKCHSGECVYRTDVPGYTRPVKEINTPLIAGVIAGCALFVVLVILVVWFLSRRSFRYGPIHLGDDSDDDMAQMMAEHKPASLQFENVAYHLNGKQILSGVQGIALPGQLMAIMGASGAGKTTFLDILARKNKRGMIDGDFYVNGEKVSDSDYRSVIGFVDQDDTLLPTLTVHETIMTSALLRLPRDMNISAKEQKVYEVEKQLGILPIKDQLIGSEEGHGRGISGGEKRRVGIACELVTSPSILFLDEPTSGLDAFNAFNVIECLVTLAKNYNRTVVFTIHQPRSNIVALFDHLVLLARGRIVYSGPYISCQNYFDNIGYACPPGFNIADYLVDLTMHADAAYNTPEENETGAFDPSSDGVRTINSSVRAIKSVASASNLSTDNMSYGSYNESIRRPATKRRQSLKQKQDRQLFTRRKTGGETPSTPKTDDEASDSNVTRRNSQDIIKLSKQQGQVPPQILDDPHQLPPAAYEATGLDFLVSSYTSSNVANTVREDIHSAVNSGLNANATPNGQPNHAVVSGTIKSYRRISYTQQFLILSRRTWRNLYRNPMLMLTHFAIAILLAVLSGFLFYGLTDDIKGFQNRLGLFFFILALFGFSTLTSLTVFSSERLLFVRERANGYYAPLTYFCAKVVFDIVPLRLIPPIIMGAIIYPMSGLTPEWPSFFRFLLTLILFNLAAAAICLFIGIVFRDGGVANLIGSLVMLFSLLFAGLLLNHDAIPPAALWLQTLSIFHYGFEALIVNEVKYLTLIDHKYGLDIEVPGASILSAFGFDNSGLWPDVVGLAIFSAAFIVIAYIAMHVLLVEKR